MGSEQIDEEDAERRWFENKFLKKWAILDQCYKLRLKSR